MDSNASRSTSYRELARHLTTRVGVVVAAVALMAGITGEASASVYSQFARVECKTGQVVAYAPAQNGVYSSYPLSRVYISSQLERWDSSRSRWVFWYRTPEWAYGTSSDQSGNTPGWYPLLTGPGFAWTSTGQWPGHPKSGMLFQYSSPWVPFGVPSGWYRIITFLRDATDGDQKYQINYTSSLASGTPYCQVP